MTTWGTTTWGRTARRLATAATIALALTAAAAVPGAGGGWGQPDAPISAFGYAPPPGGRAPEGAGDARPGDPGPGRGAGPVLGVVGYKPAVVVRLDPGTLRPVGGRRVRLEYGVSSYGWSPDRSLLVLGDVDDDAVHVVDPVRMRRLGTVKFGIVAEAPQWLAWLGPRRVVVVAGNSGDGSTLVMVDPVARKVLSRRPLAPGSLSAVGAGDRLVLLRTPHDRIGPVGLVVVDDRGGTRAVGLPGIRAGFQEPPDWDRPGAYGVSRQAALAVDPEGGRAFVVAAGATVAEVDLAGLRVTYRTLRQPLPLLRRLAHWMVPPAEAKLAAGTWRSACWLGGGSLAVWGTDASVTGELPATERAVRASGLKLIDTRTWTIRPLDPAATAARWQAGRLLAFGALRDPEGQRERGTGLTVQVPEDRRPRRLLGGRAVMDAYLNGDLVYASVDDGREEWGRVVLSLPSGRVLASSRAPLPLLLLDGRDQPC